MRPNETDRPRTSQLTREEIERIFARADEFAASPQRENTTLGAGAVEQPAHALTDLYTIRAEKKTIDGLRIALVGDLKNGRAAHALARILSNFQVVFSFVCPAAMAMPIEISDYLRERDFIVEETNDLARCILKTDVVYLSPVRREYFADPKQYAKMKNFFRIDRALLDTRPGILVLGAWDGAEEILGDSNKKSSANALLVRRAMATVDPNTE